MFDQLCDKAGNPWFSAIEKDLYINMAQIEFMQTRSDMVEFNERRREDLAKMIKQYSASSTATINLTAITDFFRIDALLGVFDKPGCSGQTMTVSVPPIQFDDYGETLQDPFAVPIDKEPGYIQYNDGVIASKIEVKSTNTPTTLILFYIKIPVSVNSQSTPKVDSELPSYVHNEIVNIAVRKAMMVTNDPNYQVQMNEIKSQE